MTVPARCRRRRWLTPTQGLARGALGRRTRTSSSSSAAPPPGLSAATPSTTRGTSRPPPPLAAPARPPQAAAATGALRGPWTSGPTHTPSPATPSAPACPASAARRLLTAARPSRGGGTPTVPTRTLPSPPRRRLTALDRSMPSPSGTTRTTSRSTAAAPPPPAAPAAPAQRRQGGGVPVGPDLRLRDADREQVAV